LELQLQYTIIKVNLNISKGKTLVLVTQASGSLRKERLALLDFRSQLSNDTDDSKAEQ
jgi:hypothetical protein